MSVQHQGKGTGGGCAPSQRECEAEDSLWVKNIQFRRLFLSIRENFQYLHCVYEWWLLSWRVGGGEGKSEFPGFLGILVHDMSRQCVPGSLSPHKRAWVQGQLLT